MRLDFQRGIYDPKKQTKLIAALKIFDLMVLIFSMLMVTAFFDFRKMKIILDSFLAVKASVLMNGLVFLGFFVICHIILISYRFYVSRRLSNFKFEAVDILKAISVGTLVLFLLSNLFGIRMINSMFLLVFWANTSVLTIFGRLTLRYGLKRFRVNGKNLRNIVIVGIHERGILFAHEIVSKFELGYRLLGFVDDVGVSCKKFDESGYKLVSTTEYFNEYIRKQAVDEVAICLPVRSHYQQAAYIASICEEHGIIVRFVSDIFNPKIAHTIIQQFDGHSIITFYTGNMQGGGVILKRVIDIVVSLLLIIALLPIMLITAILIKYTSEGPVLFVQKRLGLNKHHFGVYKFRTMYSGAEKKQAELEHLNEVKGPVFKIKNDPRITSLGKLLRKTSIDELPQLFNVLRGEMSLVGPRPLAIRDYEGFDKDWHRRRFCVRPGITCLWQISGRSSISFDQWMELDMQYIDNWSLWMDFKILLRTIPAVLMRRGAV